MAHQHTHTQGDSGAIRLAFLLNLGFTVFEIVGGLAINSVAVLSDALHDLGDSISLGLAWYLSRYAGKGSDQWFSYGYRRFSLLGAFINAMILIGGSLFILSEAVGRLASPEPFDGRGMIVIAVIGVAVNGIAAWRLTRTTSANAEMVGWHLLEDVLGWVAVLVVGVVSLFADLPILDPLLSILITVYVLVNVLRRLRSVAALFLQAVPPDVDLNRIADRLAEIDGVQSTHHIHIWSLDGEHHVLTAHLVVAAETGRDTAIRIKQAARRLLAQSDLHLEHVTLEVEYADIDCSMEEEAEPAVGATPTA